MSTKDVSESHQARWDRINLVYEREPAHEIPDFVWPITFNPPVEPFEANLMLNGPWQRESYNCALLVWLRLKTLTPDGKDCFILPHPPTVTWQN